MTRTLLSLTAHQLLGRRRGILIALLALLPIGLALLFRLAGDGDGATDFAVDMISGLVFTLLLPIGALVFGTSALGSEIEDGTIVYLLAQPIARWRIVIVKAAVASLATIALTVPAALLTAVIVLDGFDSESLWWGATVAAITGSIVYSTLFVGLSTITGRALIVGLVYVLRLGSPHHEHFRRHALDQRSPVRLRHRRRTHHGGARQLEPGGLAGAGCSRRGRSGLARRRIALPPALRDRRAILDRPP